MRSPVAWYREYLPCKALQADVYVLFSFVPEPATARLQRTCLREIAFTEPVLASRDWFHPFIERAKSRAW